MKTEKEAVFPWAGTTAGTGLMTVSAGTANIVVKTRAEAGAMREAAGTAVTVQAIRIQGSGSNLSVLPLLQRSLPREKSTLG
jgi:hypothetical protein